MKLGFLSKITIALMAIGTSATAATVNVSLTGGPFRLAGANTVNRQFDLSTVLPTNATILAATISARFVDDDFDKIVGSTSQSAPGITAVSTFEYEDPNAPPVCNSEVVNLELVEVCVPATATGYRVERDVTHRTFVQDPAERVFLQVGTQRSLARSHRFSSYEEFIGSGRQEFEGEYNGQFAEISQTNLYYEHHSGFSGQFRTSFQLNSRNLSELNDSGILDFSFLPNTGDMILNSTSLRVTYRIDEEPSISAVPLPATLPMLAFGLMGIAGLRRRRSR